MFLKLDNFCSSLSLFCVTFSTYFIMHVGLTRFHLKKKRHLLGKNLDIFPQNSTFFIQILKIMLKIDVTLKSFFVMQFFNYCLNQPFS